MKANNELLIDNITKLYNNTQGIQSIYANILPGEITAFIGPNGAGKTTLVKTIAGLCLPSDGTVSLFGMNTLTRMCKPDIGYMQTDLNVYYKMTVAEVLNLICKIKFHGKHYEEIDLFLQKYNLYEFKNCFVHTLSLGMKKKLSIIMALIGKPKLIILDEPTNGIDTHGLIQLKNDLLQYSQDNCIIIITSHVLDWIEKICTRCIFLKEGRIVTDFYMKDHPADLETIYEQLYIQQ